MQEESKEEYLARLRKERGENVSVETEQEGDEEKSPVTFKSRLKSWFFLLLFALFMYAIYQIFGMLKSN